MDTYSYWVSDEPKPKVKEEPAKVVKKVKKETEKKVPPKVVNASYWVSSEAETSKSAGNVAPQTSRQNSRSGGKISEKPAENVLPKITATKSSDGIMSVSKPHAEPSPKLIKPPKVAATKSGDRSVASVSKSHAEPSPKPNLPPKGVATKPSDRGVASESKSHAEPSPKPNLPPKGAATKPGDRSVASQSKSHAEPSPKPNLPKKGAATKPSDMSVASQSKSHAEPSPKPNVPPKGAATKSSDGSGTSVSKSHAETSPKLNLPVKNTPTVCKPNTDQSSNTHLPIKSVATKSGEIQSVPNLKQVPKTVPQSDILLPGDLERFRLFYESDHEWSLRKAFIVAHRDKLPENRLVCLANCFINSEVYGANYPSAVMQKLAELKQDLGNVMDEINAKHQVKKEAMEVKFVKASNPEADESKKMSSDHPNSSHHHHSSSHSSTSSHHHHHKSDTKLGSFDAALLSGSVPQKHKRKSSESESHDSKPKLMTFVKSESEYKSTDNVAQAGPSEVPPANSGPEKSGGYKAAMKNFQLAIGKHAQAHGEIDEKFTNLHAKIIECTEKVKRANSIEFMHFVLDKVKMIPLTAFQLSLAGHTCELFIDSILVATGTGMGKKSAKHQAFDAALEMLKKPYFQVVSVNPEKKELQSSDTPFNEEPEVVAAESPAILTKCGLEEVATRGMKRLHPDANPLQNFVIMEPMNPSPSMNAASIIRQSADFSKMKLVYDIREHGGQSWCRVLLEHEVLADVAGPTQKDAKNMASDKALEKLRHVCWSIKTKKHEDTEETGLSREEVLGEIAKSEKKIDSGIGNKLLKMMGWTGGGIGKKGTGIVEPVKADTSAINRQGLGLSSEKGITPNFIKCIRDVISDYAKSNRQDDMAFAPSFSNEERAVIHKECHKFGLKTRSHGSGDARYLVASRRRTANELFSHIMHSGGSTSKYELCPPESETLDSW